MEEQTISFKAAIKGPGSPWDWYHAVTLLPYLLDSTLLASAGFALVALVISLH